MMSDEKLVSELEGLAEGLLFMSESDYPLEVVHWKGLAEIDARFLRGLTSAAEDAVVEIVSVDRFFRNAVSDKNRPTEESRREAGKYRELVQFLKDNLDELKAYRVGKLDIPVYVVGRTKEGNWLGVSTRVVET